MHRIAYSVDFLHHKHYFCCMFPEIVGIIFFYAFCAVSAIQIFYYLFFFSRLAFYQQKAKTETQENPVSVIVCARDEAENLARNLPGILVQEYPTTHELVVVNDNSLDDGRYVIDEFKKSFKHINHIHLTQEAKLITGKKFPLSMGIRAAKYETLLLTDADCIPASEHWIHKMQGAYGENTEIVLGYGPYNKRPGILNKLIRYETFHTALQYFSYSLAGMPYMGVGRNLSYKKEIFLKNKGFSSINQIPSGDDDLFINQVANAKNTAIMIDPDTFTYSEARKKWSEWMVQKYRHYTTSRFYRPLHQFLLGLYSITLFFYYPLLILSAVFFNWQIALSIFAVRFLIQALVYYRAMHKLKEADLWPWFLLLDCWTLFYYLFTLPAIWKAPRKNWN